MTKFFGIRVAAAMIGAASLTGLGTTAVLAGGKTASSPVSVAITSPSSGSSQSASFTTSGSASTSARRASITSVQVSIDGASYQSAAGTTSWNYSVSGLASGAHTITARAADTAGNTATSSVSVTVTTASSQTTAAPPTSTIVWPRYAGTVVSGTYTLSGSSSDSTYSIAKVQWSVDGAAVASAANQSSLDYAWDTSKVAQGSHTVTYSTWNSAGGTSSASQSVTVGTATIKRVAVILYNFQNQAPPTTVQTVQDWTFGTTRSVAGYWNENSYGRLLLGGAVNPSGDVYGFYTVPYDYPTTTPCNFGPWETSALQQATAAGFNASSYDVYLLTAAVPAGCGSGVATANQDRVPWNNPPNADTWIAFAGHELGHSFGIWHHANSWTCTDSTGQPVQAPGAGVTCNSTEYGDPYDIMSAGKVEHMNAYEKGQLGLFRGGNSITVNTSGTYTLAPLTVASSAVQSIRIPRAWDSGGNPTDFYYLEYRQPTAYDVTPTTIVDYDGILIREAPDYSQTGTGSNLIDTTPGSLTTPGVHDNFDAPLRPGMYFQDSGLGLTITTVSTSATGATVQVTMGTPQCVRVAPSVTISPAVQSAPAGQTLYYTVTVANNDSPACGASTLEVTATLPSGYTQTPATYVSDGQYPAGAATSFTIAVTSPSGAISGSYQFSETVSNGSSGMSASAGANANVS